MGHIILPGKKKIEIFLLIGFSIKEKNNFAKTNNLLTLQYDCLKMVIYGVVTFDLLLFCLKLFRFFQNVSGGANLNSNNITNDSKEIISGIRPNSAKMFSRLQTVVYFLLLS